ncbi:GNAT family N-acetyltransferase [Halobacterium bonnevillei]|uniref:GNAT family N-acetyltransferase n=1 Tax=Halobacterium bonnevillei TaxID=2692200 RepID=A0A6B0SG74_9EURY|nr:GNAT family N-acetyltransferase [Halobacterium bonnevillei]MXR19616.1 GNAT family N-acetyltransferase [Halobacterium bonnevillei]
MEIRQLSLAEWGDALPDSGFEVFHTPAALSVLADHSNGELRLYGGFKGEQPVGLFPVVVQDRAVGRATLSPPPGFAVPRLGPLVMPVSPKRRKREQVNGRFAERVLAELDVDASTTLFRTVCPTSYPDPRPFVWSDLSLDTSFTYHLDVDEDPDAMLSSFSKSLRREIRDGLDLDVTVAVDGEDAVRQVFEQTRARYEEQDRGFTLEWSYVSDLARALAADDRCRTYVVQTADGDFLSGMIVLYSNDAAYYWLGGARTVHEGTSVNSLLHWRVICDIADGDPRESVDTYDLMGANTERLCRYKSKFGADLAPYYALESSGPGMTAAKTAYRLVSR